MAAPVARVTNILLSCALDAGNGGVQVVIRDLVAALTRSGRQVYFIADAPLPGLPMTSTVNALGRPVFHCPMPVFVRQSTLLSVIIFAVYLPIVFVYLARLLYTKKIDVVNCHYLAPYFVHLVIAARLLRVRIVVSVHGADIDAYPTSGMARQLVSRLIIRGAHSVVACSEALARQTSEAFPQARHKVTYVHNGLDVSRYGSTGASGRLRPPFMLCVCRHVYKKGVDTLLRAFTQISRELPNVSLVLVGDGPLLDEHKLLARTLQIGGQVIFIGNVAHAEVSAFFGTCALFVLPSRKEPFGLVLLEAAYHRKGIVCTRVGGIPEIFTDGVDALLVEPDDPAAMAEQAVRLLRDPDLAARLGEQAHRTLMARFLWQDRVQDYIRIYEGAAA